MSKYGERYAKINLATIDKSVLPELPPGTVPVGHLTDDQWRIWAVGKEMIAEIEALSVVADRAWSEHEAAGKMDCPNEPLCVALKAANDAYATAITQAGEVLEEFNRSLIEQYSIPSGGGYAYYRDGSVLLRPNKRVLYVRLDGPESLDAIVSFLDAATGRPYRGDLTKN